MSTLDEFQSLSAYDGWHTMEKLKKLKEKQREEAGLPTPDSEQWQQVLEEARRGTPFGQTSLLDRILSTGEFENLKTSTKASLEALVKCPLPAGCCDWPYKNKGKSNKVFLVRHRCEVNKVDSEAYNASKTDLECYKKRAVVAKRKTDNSRKEENWDYGDDVCWGGEVASDGTAAVKSGPYDWKHVIGHVDLDAVAYHCFLCGMPSLSWECCFKFLYGVDVSPLLTAFDLKSEEQRKNEERVREAAAGGVRFQNDEGSTNAGSYAVKLVPAWKPAANCPPFRLMRTLHDVGVFDLLTRPNAGDLRADIILGSRENSKTCDVCFCSLVSDENDLFFKQVHLIPASIQALLPPHLKLCSCQRLHVCMVHEAADCMAREAAVKSNASFPQLGCYNRAIRARKELLERLERAAGCAEQLGPECSTAVGRLEAAVVYGEPFLVGGDGMWGDGKQDFLRECNGNHASVILGKEGWTAETYHGEGCHFAKPSCKFDSCMTRRFLKCKGCRHEQIATAARTYDRMSMSTVGAPQFDWNWRITRGVTNAERQVGDVNLSSFQRGVRDYFESRYGDEWAGRLEGACRAVYRNNLLCFDGASPATKLAASPGHDCHLCRRCDCQQFSLAAEIAEQAKSTARNSLARSQHIMLKRKQSKKAKSSGEK